MWLHALRTLTWEWKAPFELRDPSSGTDVLLWPTDLGKLLHHARESLRRNSLRALAGRRATYKGLERGAQRAITVQALDLCPDPYLAALLRDLMAGGIKWGAARHQMKAVPTPNCQWCNQGRDNVHHLVIDCPAPGPLRAWAGVSLQDMAAYPPCFRYHGIVPIGAQPAIGLRRHQLFLLAAVAYRALVQLQPKCDLSLHVPSLLTNMLGVIASKWGFPLGPAPPLTRC